MQHFPSGACPRTPLEVSTPSLKTSWLHPWWADDGRWPSLGSWVPLTKMIGPQINFIIFLDQIMIMIQNNEQKPHHILKILGW